MLVAEEDLLEPGRFEGTNHGIGMPDQVQIMGRGKVALSAAENLDIQGIGGRLIYQHSVTEPLLQQTIKLRRGKLLVLALLHQLFGLVGVALLDLHQGPQRPFQPEAVALSQGLVPLGQRVEGKQLQLGGRKQLRMSAQHDAQQGGA